MAINKALADIQNIIDENVKLKNKIKELNNKQELKKNSVEYWQEKYNTLNKKYRQYYVCICNERKAHKKTIQGLESKIIDLKALVLESCKDELLSTIDESLRGY